jgi:hypothetical protein
MNSAYFVQCIKAGGINFAASYNQFFDWKRRRADAMANGIPQ